MGLWRKKAPVLDIHGAIRKGGMWKPQLQWWQLDNYMKVLVGGFGSGKTFIGAKRSIAVALENACRLGDQDIVPHMTVSPSYKIAKRTIVPAIKVLLSGKQRVLNGFNWTYNKTEHEFNVWYKGRHAVIWCLSGDDPDSLRGPNVGSAWIDEPFIQEDEVLMHTQARVRHPKARQREITMTGTPEQLNWGYDICEGDRKDDYDVGVVFANTKDNKALPSDYVDTLLRAFTERAAEAYVDGKFVSLQEGTIYYGFDRFVNVQSLPDPGGELGVGMDFNVNPMAAIVFWLKDDHMHIMDEIELPNADTAYMCRHIIDSYKTPEGRCRVEYIFPDATGNSRSTKAPGGKSDFSHIKESGFRIDAPSRNPFIRDRENAVNGKFSPAVGHSTLTIDPKCKKLIGYLTKATHEDRNKPSGKRMSHLLDAMGYPIHRLFPVEENRVIGLKTAA